MNLPRAVLEADRKAEEALQRLQAARQPKQPAQDPEPGDQQAVSDPPIESDSETVAEAPVAPAQDVQVDPEEKWETRYKSLIGKYNAEVPRLSVALKERDSKLNSLTAEVDALRAQLTAKKEPLIKPEEVSEYGEPLVDLIRRAAREEVQAKDVEIAELKRKLDSVATATVETREVGFFDKLAAQVPDWMTINDDPEFHSWLRELDELTGAQRQTILSEAEEKRDADRVARFFKAYKRVQETKDAATRSSLDSQVAPVSSRADSPPPGKKLWTRSEIADFYSRDRRGEYTEEKAAAIDSEIQLAIREGRIR